MKLVADLYTNKETECMINKFGTITPSIKYPFHLIIIIVLNMLLFYLLLRGAANLFIILLAPRLIPYKKMMAVKLGLVN